MAKTSTKRLSAGSSLGITRGSTSRGAASGGVSSSSAPIAQGGIETPDLVPQARPLDFYGRANVPNAPEATFIPQWPSLPESTAAKNAQALANSLGSLNKNLNNLVIDVAQWDAAENKAAKKHADEVAQTILLTGGNPLGPIDKLRNDAQKIYTDKTGKYSNDQKEHAKHRYELLRNLDPRTNDYLENAVQYQHGLNVVAGLPAFVEGSKLNDGSQFIVNPNGEAGQPSALDILINDKLSSEITDSNALARLRPQIISQTANIKARMGTLYATQQDQKITDAANLELDTTIQTGTFTTIDGTIITVDGTGIALTMSLDGQKIWGMSLEGTTEFEKELIGKVVSSFVTKVQKDPASFLKEQEILAEEISNIRVGPVEQGDKRPFLYQKLGISQEQLRQRFINESNAAFIRAENAQKNAAVSIGRSAQDQKNAAQLLIWQDSDTSKDAPGNQPFVYTDPVSKRQVSSTINVLGARNWIQEERKKINQSSDSQQVKLARHESLNALEGQIDNQIETNRVDIKIQIENDLDNETTNPRMLRAQIKYLRTTGILDEATYNSLDEQIDAVIKYKDTKVGEAQDSGEDRVIEILEQGILCTGEGFELGDGISTQESNRIQTLLLSTRQKARKIMTNPNLDDQQKIQQINELYEDAEIRFKKIIKLNKESGRRFDELAQEELNKIGYKDQINVSNVQPGNTTGTTNTQGGTTTTGGTTEGTQGTGNNQSPYFDNQAFELNESAIEVKVSELDNIRNQWEARNENKVFQRTGGLPIIGLNGQSLGTIYNEKDFNKAIEKREKEIDDLTAKGKRLQSPTAQRLLYWQGGEVITHFDSRGQASAPPVINLPSNRRERNTILNTAKKQAVAEADGRFGNNLTERVSNTLGKKEWIERRTNEIVYQLLNPEAPDIRGTLVTVQGDKSEKFGVTPTDVLRNLTGNQSIRAKRRGNRAANDELADESRTVPLYETYVFAEQINALENGANWVPYAGDTNLLLQKMKVEPITFFENQYQAHFGQPMPAALKARITKTLMNPTFKGWSGKTQPFYREDFTGDNRQASSVLDQGTLIAGDLQPGMLGNKKKDLETKMLNVIHLGESTVDTKHGGYEAFNQGGADEGKTVLGFSGTYGDHPANKGKKLTEMTIQQILDIQDSGYDFEKYPKGEAGTKKWHDSGGIHAAGRDQFIRSGLRDAMELAGIKPTEKFTPEIQDRLAIALLVNRGPEWWTSMKGNKELIELLEQYKKPETEESSTISPATGLA